MNHTVVRNDPRRARVCVMCGTKIIQRWNYEHCSPECCMVDDLSLDVEAYNLTGYWI